METPQSVLVTAGDKAILECSATGTPMPQIRWLRDNQLIAMDARVMQTRNDSLVIHDVRESDRGDYTCEASNGMDSPPQRVVTLTVLGEYFVCNEAMTVCVISTSQLLLCLRKILCKF